MTDTEKRLHFPSMEDGDDDDLDFDYQDYESFDGDLKRDELFNDDGSMKNKPFDDGGGGDKSSDGIRAGELEAYNKAKEIIGEGEGFQYFPDQATEENNQRFSMTYLKKEWGYETQRNIGIANFFYKTFLDQALKKDAELSGIASHYLMVFGFHKAALQAEKFGKQMMAGESESGIRTLKFKGMTEVTKKALAERCRELARRVYDEAKNKIIAMHGSISHG